MLQPEQDHFRHDIIKITGAERSGKAHRRAIMLADAHEIDGAVTADLSARQEEEIDAARAGAIEQLAAAGGEEIMLAALQQRHIRPSAAALAREQSRRRRDGRSIA